ncbi:hypothetical protein FJZ36_03910 [Candidatus Poribacteria bacterium]|nr:hypothetical protein [Candidatus Poribacteria bacterium]
MRRVICALVWLGWVSAQSMLWSQEAQEIIPLNPVVGHELDAEERLRFNAFKDVEGFIRAFVTQSPDGYVLNVVYERSGQRWLERVRIASEDLERMRRALVTTGQSRSGVGGSDGRLSLVLHSTIYGLFVYGTELSELLGVDETRTRIGLFMLGSGAGFAGGMYGTQGYDRGNGYATMLTTGSYIGLYYGLIPSLWTDERIRSVTEEGVEFLEDPEGPDRTRSVGMMVGLPAGVAAMHFLTKDGDVTSAEGDGTLLGSAVGAAYGVAGAYLAGASDNSGDKERRMYLASSAALIPVGGWLGHRLAQNESVTQGRVWSLALGGAMGAFSGITAVRLADGDAVRENGKPYVWASLLGFPAGLAIVYRLTDREEYSLQRAALLWTGTVAGGLFGAGMVYVLTESDDSRPYLLAATAGGAAAFAIVHRVTRTAERVVARADGPWVPFPTAAELGFTRALGDMPASANDRRVTFASPGDVVSAFAMSQATGEGVSVPLVRVRF